MRSTTFAPQPGRPLAALLVVRLLVVQLLVVQQLVTPYAPARAAESISEPTQQRLYDGTAPGSEHASGTEVTEVLFGEPKARNITQPTLTVFQPAAPDRNGTAVIVAPGGGFLFLSITSEGAEVARALAARGITAVMLRYRLNETPDDRAALMARLKPAFSMTARALYQTPGGRLASDDAAEAVRVVRQHARAWGVAPDRVGFIGFSAGALVAIHLALRHDAASRPDFVAALYGAAMAEDLPVPDDAPPLFLAVAADDPQVGQDSAPLFDAWRKGGHAAELHIYQSGGHGFGMNRKGTSSDHWIDEYLWWLDARGLLKKS